MPPPTSPPTPPTAEELAEAGVEVGVMATPTPDPKRVKFAEHPLPGEPRSDRRLEVTGGRSLRERLVRLEGTATDVLSSAPAAAPTGLAVAISHALLDDKGAVVVDGAGAPRLAPVHEVVFTGETAARLGEAGIERALLEQREVAAAKAADHFAGMDALERVLGRRF